MMNPNDESLVSFSKAPPSSSSPLGTESNSMNSALITQLGTGFSTIQPTISIDSSLSSSIFLSPFIDFQSIENTASLSYSNVSEIMELNPIPPFLSKTFDLVDDQSIDPIISWGSSGESFVVWNPLEFARLILPRNFKHNNFSSFVRQLNTNGFRKINTDKWEFANEGFLRGKRHLLRNIQRRKSPQTQHSGSDSDVGKSGLESEIERLRKEKSSMMQEILGLQKEQHGTIQHVQVVKQKLEAAEQRQKKMVSFLAKLIQNPLFLARVRQNKEQRSIIASPRKMRKFVEHHQQESSKSEASIEGRIIKDISDLESMPFQPEKIVSDELAVAQEQIQNTGRSEDPLFKGKSKVSHQPNNSPEFFSSFPEDLTKQENFPEFNSPGIESIVKRESFWSTGFEADIGMPSSSDELWEDLSNYYMPELGVSAGFPDIWDLRAPHVAGGSGIEKCPGDESSPFDELDTQTEQPKDDSSKKIDP